MKHHHLTIAALSAAAALAVTGCKTSEANYRAAYERAIEGREDATPLDSTVYGRHRRSMDSREVVVGSDTVELKTQRVSVTEGGGGIREYLKPYSVVVGQFKQLFNAESLRGRLVEGGYPRAFIVQTAEPYYYIILSSHASLEEAAAALSELGARTDFPVAMREPVPFVLYSPM